MRARGLFISFEGLDGSGKTTQMRRLAKRLRACGHVVLETVEPGGTEIGGKIRQVLLDAANQELSPIAELLLYFASRAQNVDERIGPALRRGEMPETRRSQPAKRAWTSSRSNSIARSTRRTRH